MKRIAEILMTLLGTSLFPMPQKSVMMSRLKMTLSPMRGPKNCTKDLVYKSDQLNLKLSTRLVNDFLLSVL